MTVNLILKISGIANFENYYYLLFLIDHTVSFTARRPLSVVNIALVPLLLTSNKNKLDISSIFKLKDGGLFLIIKIIY